MITIRSLGPRELRQVLSLLGRYSDRDSEYRVLKQMQQLYIPLHRLSRTLPLRLQFVPGIFVAVAQRKVLGLVWLSRDGRHKRRWKIDHLILDPDTSTYDVGTQLLNYAINRYGGDGVQTFLAYVDQYDLMGLGLLKSCGFRRCARNHYFSLQHTAIAGSNPQDKAKSYPAGLRDAHTEDAPLLAQLYNNSLPVEARMCLEKSEKDFKRPVIVHVADRLRGLFTKRWVIEDAIRDTLLASIQVNTSNYRDFHVSILVNSGWDDLYTDCLHFAIRHIEGISSQSRIYIESLETSQTAIKTLEENGFQRDGIAEVLVKDYWIPIEDKGIRLQSPLLLFGRPSPAMN